MLFDAVNLASLDYILRVRLFICFAQDMSDPATCVD
jgi:hypothetical protein